MTVSALIAVRLAEGVVGLTAGERFKAMQSLDAGGGFMTSRLFTVIMVLVLVGSVVALLVVSLYRKAGELKTAEKLFSERAMKKGLSESETDMLMAIAVKAGLKKSEDIFSMSEAFEQGASQLLGESHSGGRATAETGQIERHLAGLREKLGFRKASSPAKSSPVKPVEKSASATVASAKPDVKSANDKLAGISGRKAAFIAMFPFAKTLDQAGESRQLPEFLPASIIGVVGQVVSVETTLPANVGDRVLVVLGSKGGSEEASRWELIEDIGVVQQSAQPAESIEAPNGRRLAISMAGVSEAQAAQLASFVASAKAAATAKDNIGGSQDAEAAAQPVIAKEEIK